MIIYFLSPDVCSPPSLVYDLIRLRYNNKTIGSGNTTDPFSFGFGELGGAWRRGRVQDYGSFPNSW